MLYKTEFRQLNNDLFWNFCKSIEIDKGTVKVLKINFKTCEVEEVKE